MRRIIIGDVHGCLAELRDLLQRADYAKDRDQLFFVGDLVDRGPASTETVVFVRDLMERNRAVVVLGNHDEKYVRYRRRLAQAQGDPTRVEMRFPPAKQTVFATLRAADLDWLAQLPLYHRGDGFLVVHAGLCPRRHRSPP